LLVKQESRGCRSDPIFSQSGLFICIDSINSFDSYVRLQICLDFDRDQIVTDNFIAKNDLEKIQKNIEEDLVNNYKERYAKKIEGEIEFETVTKSGRADKEILEFAEKEKVDLIVMGTHGRTGIEHVFFGSVAEKVLRHSPFPVFVMPDKKKLEQL